MTTTILIRGAHFRGQEIKELSNNLTEGAIITLEREPDNKHDPYAVKAFYDDIHIGYVQAEHSAAVSEMIDAGELSEAIFIRHVEGPRNSLYPECSID